MPYRTEHEVVEIAVNEYGITHEDAAEAIDTYIDQIETIDGKEIDRSNIEQEDANFLIIAIGAGIAAGDISPKGQLRGCM